MSVRFCNDLVIISSGAGVSENEATSFSGIISAEVVKVDSVGIAVSIDESVGLKKSVSDASVVSVIEDVIVKIVVVSFIDSVAFVVVSTVFGVVDIKVVVFVLIADDVVNAAVVVFKEPDDSVAIDGVVSWADKVEFKIC